MSSESSTSIMVDGGAVVESAVGGSGAGGTSGPPPSAMTETANASESAIANSRLFTVWLPPFFGADEQDSIVPIAADPQSLFAHFWELHLANEPRKCLLVCDRLLEVIDPADFDAHLRQYNGRQMAHRALLDYASAWRAHLAARPFLAATKDKRLAGDCHHGAGITLTETGHHVAAFKALETARDLYREAEEWFRIRALDVNAARLMVRAGRPEVAHKLLDGLGDGDYRADAEIARAMAYEAEGDRPGARKAIARAFSLLADSTNEATRAEAKAVFERIEGKGSGAPA